MLMKNQFSSPFCLCKGDFFITKGEKGEFFLTVALNALTLYYHATMKDFEKKELQKRKNIQHVRNVSKQEKKKMLKENRAYLKNWFSIEHIKAGALNSLLEEDYGSFIRFLSFYPLQNCFSIPIEIGNQFPCPLIHGNIGWINQNPDGHIRYYSKKKGELSIAFDLIDLIEITEGVDTLQAIQLAREALSGCYSKTELSESVYQKNISLFSNSLNEKSSFANFLKPLRYVYEELQVMADVRSKELGLNSNEGEVLFFASNRYLQNRIGDVSNVNISRIVNALDAIGLIKRIHQNEIPDKQRKQSLAWAGMLGYKNMISYFRIPPFCEVREKAEEIVNIIRGKGWTYGNFTSLEKKRDLFEKKKQQTVEEKLLHERFFRNLLLRKYVTKEILMNDLPCSLNKAKRIVDENWNDWLKEFNCTYKRPTEKMKQKLRLKSNNHIAYVHKS